MPNLINLPYCRFCDSPIHSCVCTCHCDSMPDGQDCLMCHQSYMDEAETGKSISLKDLYQKPEVSIPIVSVKDCSIYMGIQEYRNYFIYLVQNDTHKIKGYKVHDHRGLDYGLYFSDLTSAKQFIGMMVDVYA